MAKFDTNASKHVSEYIETLSLDAKEICLRLRKIILSASPLIVEDWKWGPNYNCEGMVCGFSSFKNHTKLTFFRGGEMSDNLGLFNHCLENVGNRSIKFTSLDQLDEAKLSAYVTEAIKLNQTKRASKKIGKENIVPEALQNLLNKNPNAKKHFDEMAPYRRKEFIEQVETAKRPETLAKRLDKMLPMLEAGIGWNDKHREKNTKPE